MKNKNKINKVFSDFVSQDKKADINNTLKGNLSFVAKFKKYHGLWIVVFFVLGIVFSWWFVYQSAQAGLSILSSYQSKNFFPTVGQAAAIEQATVFTRRLDGVIVSKEKANLWPYAVMIENLLSTRPQGGLSQAAVVYETLAEGGSTRFVAVFEPTEVIPEIMPVRSARPYYLEWVSEYGALYAHAGGSPQALTIIRENPDINDLEALSGDAVYFWRDRTKYAPHNLVTSSEKMNLALRDKELSDKETDFRSWEFKDEAELEKRGEDGKILMFNFSYGKTYKVDYKYNRESNVYLRYNADQEHKDKNTDEQLKVKNVIVQIVREPVLSGGKGRLDIYVGGEGKAWIFRDGEVIEGVWKKGSRTDRTSFYDSEGNEVEFNRGNTWVHVISETQEVVYK